MFTLNELYSTSMSKTQNLLSHITGSTRPGTFLLVVDSPGSYSTVSLNGTEKKYPMQWLLDYTLLGPPKKVESDSTDAKWEKVIDESSRWFRLPEGLNYPIELENMRYQIHLYRRRDDDK
jgi:25S rRNA (uracil2843-N3)-methyltransferase